MIIKFEAAMKELMGQMWESPHLRPYFRAVHGQANTLRKLGRHKEALAKYLLLQKYDDNWYGLNRSTYSNYRYQCRL